MKEKSLIFITGGHATPAVACINELRSRGYKNIIYIGQKKSLLFDKNFSSEFRLITEKVFIPFKSIIAGKVSLFWGIHSVIWLLRLPIGFIQAFYWLLKYQPSVVLTFGSHVGVPVVYCAYILKIPVVAHEQTVTIGRANKFIQKYATKVCYSWEGSIKDEDTDSSKYLYTGNPVRKEILKPSTNRFTFFNQNRKTVFITGGNQGAHALNEFIFENIDKLVSQYNIIHQTGSNSIYNDLRKASELAEKVNSNGVVYIPDDYIFVDEMAEAYQKANVMIARGGANTVTEVLALEKRVIIIPLMTSSGNEQFLNGQLLENLGLAIIVKQENLHTLNLIESIENCAALSIKNKQEVDRLSSTHLNAEKRIADIVIETIK